MHRTTFLLPAVLLTISACGPNRTFTPDAAMDAPAEVSLDVFSDATDTSQGDGLDSMDVMCVNATCNTSCMMRGYSNGFCTSGGTCFCSGLVDASMPDTSDATMPTDTGADVPIESSVIGCGSNADCPPTTFCNGAGCTMRGFCSPRGDIGACGTDGPAECGCDGMWYTNNCTRIAMGVRLNTNPTMCGPAPDAGSGD